MSTFKFQKGKIFCIPFIDFIYESWGIENIGIREQEQSVFISMKAGESIYSKFDSHLLMNQLIPFIQEGTIEIAEEFIYCPKCLSQNQFRVANKDVRCGKAISRTREYHYEPVGGASHSSSSKNRRILEKRICSSF